MDTGYLVFPIFCATNREIEREIAASLGLESRFHRSRKCSLDAANNNEICDFRRDRSCWSVVGVRVE